MANKLPLEGIRVVDITVVWAGPFATQMLGDLGAEVIRVEAIQRFAASTRGNMARPRAEQYATSVTGGFFQYVDRQIGERPWNRCTMFNCHGRNKYGMTVDLTQPWGVEIFKRLVAVSDILIENNAPNVMDSLGLNYDVLKEVNPRLIMIRAAAFGQKGPKRNFRGMGHDVEAVVPHYWLGQYSVGDLPKRSNTYTMDTTGACSMVLAALMGLNYRERTGRGQYVDLAQSQTVLACLGEAFMDYAMNGRVQEAMGNRLPAAIQGCYRCTGDDDWVVVTIRTDEEWRGLCRAMGNPPWTEEERFADGLSRYSNHDELDRRIEEWTSQRDKYEVMYLLQGEGVAAGPVLSEKDAHNDPHANARDFFLEITQQWCGTHRYAGFAWKYSKTPQEVKLPPVGLGEHNEYVYKQVLHVSDEEYDRLGREQKIGDAYLSNVR